MSNLGEVIGWKFDHAPGMRTREKSDGTMEIFDWPAALGAKPTAANIRSWTQEFNALPTPVDPNDELAQSLTDLKGTGATVDQVIDALIGIVTAR